MREALLAYVHLLQDRALADYRMARLEYALLAPHAARAGKKTTPPPIPKLLKRRRDDDGE